MVEHIKSYGLLVIDVLRVDTSKLVKSVEPDIGLSGVYEASIWFKESNQHMYFQARQVSVHILLLVVANLNKMGEHGVLEQVSKSASNWASSIVTIFKPVGDFKNCGDYKVCSDSFPLPNTETA